MAISTNSGEWGMSSWEQQERMMREKQYEYERQYREMQNRVQLQMMPQGMISAEALRGTINAVLPVVAQNDLRRRSTILLLKEEE